MSLFKASNGWEIMDIAKSTITNGVYLSMYNEKYPEDDFIFCVKHAIENNQPALTVSLLLGPENKQHNGPQPDEFIDELITAYREAYQHAFSTMNNLADSLINRLFPNLKKDIT